LIYACNIIYSSKYEEIETQKLVQFYYSCVKMNRGKREFDTRAFILNNNYNLDEQLPDVTEIDVNYDLDTTIETREEDAETENSASSDGQSSNQYASDPVGDQQEDAYQKVLNYLNKEFSDSDKRKENTEPANTNNRKNQVNLNERKVVKSGCITQKLIIKPFKSLVDFKLMNKNERKLLVSLLSLTFILTLSTFIYCSLLPSFELESIYILILA
jgi:hypothetical protein